MRSQVGLWPSGIAIPASAQQCLQRWRPVALLFLHQDSIACSAGVEPVLGPTCMRQSYICWGTSSVCAHDVTRGNRDMDDARDHMCTKYLRLLNARCHFQQYAFVAVQSQLGHLGPYLGSCTTCYFRY